jgi:hypothetical protein
LAYIILLFTLKVYNHLRGGGFLLCVSHKEQKKQIVADAAAARLSRIVHDAPTVRLTDQNFFCGILTSLNR